MLIKDKSKRLGAKGGNEVLSHPFFAELDLEKLSNKEIRAPFIPKATDPELMRQEVQQVVWLKDLRESVSKVDVDQALFSDFGTDID